MKIKRQSDHQKILLTLAFFTAFFLLRFTLSQEEPLGLPLLFALCQVSCSPFVSLLSFVISGILFASAKQILFTILQGAILFSGFLFADFLKKRQAKGAFLPPHIALVGALALFVWLADFTPYITPFITLNDALTQKIVIACAIFLLSSVFYIAVKSLLKKWLKCRLKESELLFCVLFFMCLGVGICRFFGFDAYTGIAFYILLVFAFTVKDATTVLCAFTLCLPTLIVYGLSPERFFIYAIVLILFSKYGRLALVSAFLCVFFAYGYADGLYFLSAGALTSSILSATLPALLFVLTPTPLLRSLENKLIFYREKHLSRVAINRNRTCVGEQLFELSAVFREIKNTFASLDDKNTDNTVKEQLKTAVVGEVCKQCPQYKTCKQKGITEEVFSLVSVGALKGKVSLIDIPKRISEACVNQSSLLYAVNLRLADYKKYLTEAENAESGRLLLARQAEGISEILRDMALEQSQPLTTYTDKEKLFSSALATVGIITSEVLIYGDENNLTLSLITYGKADVSKISAVASHLFGVDMTISKRLQLGNDKYCCILRRKPKFDASFGVATKKKTGEKASGDTHALVKIDEHRFMVALSDGMGSGEYAKRVSENTISLLESFYQAKMPPSTILNTVNKLLAFTKDETFACVDIAVVDLQTGVTDIVKIGSPVGFILSGNTVKVLENGTLPLGILDNIHPVSSRYTLTENDVLLFLSDGISGAFGSTTDLFETLKKIPIKNPQQLADTLLEQAVACYGGVAKDDMTAVAVRLFKSA